MSCLWLGNQRHTYKKVSWPVERDHVNTINKPFWQSTPHIVIRDLIVGFTSIRRSKRVVVNILKWTWKPRLAYANEAECHSQFQALTTFRQIQDFAFSISNLILQLLNASRLSHAALLKFHSHYCAIAHFCKPSIEKSEWFKVISGQACISNFEQCEISGFSFKLQG